MASLFVLSGRDVGRSIELSDETTFGRSPECTVRLNDRSISRKHCKIERRGTRWFVLDLGSRNGVRLKGERVEEAELADYDELLFGELSVRFREQLEAPSAPAPPARGAPTEPPDVPAPAVDVEASPRLRLGGTGRARPLEDESEIELEEDIDLGETTVRDPAPVRSAAFDAANDGRARILAERRPAGILTGDLEQLPFWMRALLVLVGLALAGLCVWGAFRLVLGARGG